MTDRTEQETGMIRAPNTKLAAAVLAAVAFLAACSGSEADTTPTSTPTPTPTPTETAAPVVQSVDNVYDLRAAVESTSYACTGWEVLSGATGAVERATCTDDVVLSIYADATQMQTSVENLEELMREVGLASAHLTGPNWSINCGDVALCSQFADVLPGDIQSVPER